MRMRSAVGPSLWRRAVMLVCVTGLSTASTTLAQRQADTGELDERIRDAERVVVATTRSVTARWHTNEHGDRLIVSQLVLAVGETLKGAGSAALVIDVEGGTLDGYTLQVSGLRVPQPGERAVYFLDPAARGTGRSLVRGHSVLPVGPDDVVRGSGLRLDQLRARTRHARP